MFRVYPDYSIDFRRCLMLIIAIVCWCHDAMFAGAGAQPEDGSEPEPGPLSQSG